MWILGTLNCCSNYQPLGDILERHDPCLGALLSALILVVDVPIGRRLCLVNVCEGDVLGDEVEGEGSPKAEEEKESTREGAAGRATAWEMKGELNVASK